MQIDPFLEQKIEAYILINHEYETVTDLADSLGVSWGFIKKYCIKLGVTPVTPIGKLLYYAEQHCEHETLSEMAQKLSVNTWYLQKKLKDAGIPYFTQRNELKGKEATVKPEPIAPKFTDEQRNGLSAIFLELDLKLKECGNGKYRLVPNETTIERPPAEYNNITSSETVREFLEIRGINIKR